MSSVKERFLRYVQVETTSCEENSCCPSTPGQKVLGEMLAREMLELGIRDARMDGHGYVYGTIPAKGDARKPAIGLIAHMDTSDAVPGATKPRIIPDYDGGTIRLENGTEVSGFDFLPGLKGEELIVTAGDSVLGADDKAGVAEIMAAGIRLLNDPSIKHGEVEICFTPDEEVGGGAEDLDLERFDAEFAYTVDGGELGEIENENFNASSAKVSFTGFAIHPGSAKNRMKNACRMAADFASLVPEYESPEHTEGREGFFHLVGMKGSAENCMLFYILRDHDADKLAWKEEYLRRTADIVNFKYGGDVCKVEIRESYRNMIEVLRDRPDIMARAEAAFRSVGVEPVSRPIRGGTDGARLSFRGLPCPNLSTGGINAHGRLECACVTDMEKMVDVLIEIVRAR